MEVAVTLPAPPLCESCERLMALDESGALDQCDGPRLTKTWKCNGCDCRIWERTPRVTREPEVAD